MPKYTVRFSGDGGKRDQSFSSKGDAELCIQNRSKPGDVIGLEGPRGGAKFFLRNGRTIYPISARVAALELAMRGGR